MFNNCCLAISHILLFFDIHCFVCPLSVTPWVCGCAKTAEIISVISHVYQFIILRNPKDCRCLIVGFSVYWHQIVQCYDQRETKKNQVTLYSQHHFVFMLLSSSFFRGLIRMFSRYYAGNLYTAVNKIIWWKTRNWPTGFQPVAFTFCNYMFRCSVRRRSRRTFSTHFEIFRRRFDGVVIYFFNSDFKFFDDASKFSVCSFCVVFIFS